MGFQPGQGNGSPLLSVEKRDKQNHRFTLQGNLRFARTRFSQAPLGAEHPCCQQQRWGRASLEGKIHSGIMATKRKALKRALGTPSLPGSPRLPYQEQLPLLLVFSILLSGTLQMSPGPEPPTQSTGLSAASHLCPCPPPVRAGSHHQRCTCACSIWLFGY